MTFIPQQGGISYLQVDTEGSAATDDLDHLVSASNYGLQDGDLVIVRQAVNSIDVTLRDITTSGAASQGLQLPGNTSINLAASAATAQFVYFNSNWLLVSSALN